MKGLMLHQWLIADVGEPSGGWFVDHVTKSLNGTQARNLCKTCYRQSSAAKIERIERCVRDEIQVVLAVTPKSLRVDDHLRIHVATSDGADRIFFDCSRLNEAGQWVIIGRETGRCIS